ncbi:hypothetical protein [Sphingopyxis fribergensis]|uniref:hypothetical protein n=1 Tax=Sphingopyxis fribergensis TaxID=1515612 RepID=UPI0011DD41BE|nr:hypothetical protein [Sphingopyxis fribergensis]
MSVRISSIANAGEFDRERVVLQIEEDCDLGKYVVFCVRRSGPNAVDSGNVPAAYWFADKPVKKGDVAVLYSKAGKRSEKVSESGHTSHFFYWGRPESIWTAEKRAVLIDTRSYKFAAQ